MDEHQKSREHRFHFVQTGQTSGAIYDNNDKIAEIKDLQLCNVRFHPSRQVVIGEKVKMPLFWWQYANHEDPLRNAGADGKLLLVSNKHSEFYIEASATNADKGILSYYRIKVDFSKESESYVFTIKANLEIPKGREWAVTYNSVHGEVEFCNLWPEGSFEWKNDPPKSYDACYVRQNQNVIRIPHHHLETSDKTNILLSKGDCLGWFLEDENPVVEILSEQEISAGICAYMWDAHFGYRVISREQKDSTKILTNQTFEAEFRLYTIDREKGKSIVAKAQELVDPEIENIPIYLDGVNTFSKTLLDLPEQTTDMWPWVFETDSGLDPQDIFKFVKEKGYKDRFSLSIQQQDRAVSRWVVTTLGPAYGQRDFKDGAKYRLSAYVCSEDAEETRVAIRLHRKGIGDIFDTGEYDLFYSPTMISGNNDWQKIEVITPPISPKPDRIHLILEQEGPGKSWFDNVLFERIY